VPTAIASTAPPLEGAEPLFDAQALRDADRRAQHEHAMPSIVLMERAGLATAEAIVARFPRPGAAAVLVGTGNNGGDGMVVARHLREAGWLVRVLAPRGGGPATPDGVAMAAVARSLGIRVEPFDPALPPPDLVVDALLGTGARGAPRDELAAAVEWAVASGAPIVACDVPSGVDAETGEVAGLAVRARLTATYAGDKVGLRVRPGADHAGEVVVVDIGIPSDVRLAPAAWRAGEEVLAGLPRKRSGGEKYQAGAVLVVAGAEGLTGAAVLSSTATLRAGAGLTVLVTAASAQPVVAAHLTEVMPVPAPERDGGLAPEAIEAVRAQLGRVSAVAIGPGLGRASGTGELVRGVLETAEQPVVVDADALWHLGTLPEWLASRPGPTVLTPHSGEAARLLGWERAEVEARRLAASAELVARTGAVVLLKGPDTIVRGPGEPPVVNATGSQALATAGSGDVLTGVVAAMLARGAAPVPAAALAAALHGRAGRLAGNGDGTLAGDLLGALPRALGS
jgi:NAD(P)H-hydrate epimerase